MPNSAPYTFEDTVSVIDGRTNTATETVKVGGSPSGVPVNPNTRMVYVVNTYAGTVSVIDGRTNTVNNTVAVGKSPFGVASSVSVNPNTNMVYVANADGTVPVIDGRTNTLTKIPPATVGDETEKIPITGIGK